MEDYCIRQTIMAPGHVMMINCYPHTTVAAANHSWAECSHWTKIIIARRPSLTNILVVPVVLSVAGSASENWDVCQSLSSDEKIFNLRRNMKKFHCTEAYGKCSYSQTFYLAV